MTVPQPAREAVAQARAEVAALHAEFPGMTLEVDECDPGSWSDLLLSHADGTAIASIERNVVERGSLGADEVAEFLEGIANARPASAAAWLTTFLGAVSVVYAFQHLSGTEEARGDEALRVVQQYIWALGDAIIQADAEGFTNEEGFHIVWQFSESVAGTRWMAVLRDGEWQRFEMDLGDALHRAHFLAGAVPPDAKRG